MAAKICFALIIGVLAIWSIDICTAEIPIISWGCPLPKLDRDFCKGKKREIACNISTDCFEDVGESVCCGADCGGRTCYVDKPRFGECPFEPTPAGLCGKKKAKLLCGVDNECPGRQKCCFEGCLGTRCVDPKGPENRRFGCPFNRKIPKKCRKPPKKTCLLDRDCKGKKNCCRHPCGYNKCTKVKQNKGECRKVAESSKICKPQPLKCGSDQDCKNKDLKCCQTECGGSECRGRCVDSKTFKVTVKSEHAECKDCTCSQLNKKGVLMDRACLNNTKKILIHCCESCKPYAQFAAFGDLDKN